MLCYVVQFLAIPDPWRFRLIPNHSGLDEYYTAFVHDLLFNHLVKL